MKTKTDRRCGRLRPQSVVSGQGIIRLSFRRRVNCLGESNVSKRFYDAFVTEIAGRCPGAPRAAPVRLPKTSGNSWGGENLVGNGGFGTSEPLPEVKAQGKDMCSRLTRTADEGLVAGGAEMRRRPPHFLRFLFLSFATVLTNNAQRNSKNL